MGTKYYFEKPRLIGQNQVWSQALPKVLNPIKETVLIETRDPVWIDRNTGLIAEFEKLSLPQKPAHHVTWKQSYDYSSNNYQDYSSIASLNSVIGIVNKGLDPYFNSKVTSNRAVPYYSAFGCMPDTRRILLGQNGLLGPGNGVQTDNGYYPVGSIHEQKKIKFYNSVHSMTTALYCTYPRPNSLHTYNRLGDPLYLNKRHMKTYKPDTKSQRIECDETCHRKNHPQHFHSQSIPLATKSYVPRFRIRYEWRYDSDRWIIVSATCNAVEQMCRINNRGGVTKLTEAGTKFFTAVAPAIPLADYFWRIAWFYDCPKECFVLVLEYIHRYIKYKPEFVVNHNTAHMLIATCMMVACKFFDDFYFDRTFYAKVVGLPAVTMSALELEFLFIISFDLFMQPEQYQRRYTEMLYNNKSQNKVIIRPESMRYN